MNHNGWHRATIPRGLQNMLNKLVPRSCKIWMHIWTTSHVCIVPWSSTEFLSLLWLKSSFGIFLTAWPERGEEEGSIHQASYHTSAFAVHSLLLTSSDSSVGSALDPAPLYVTECPAVTTSLKEQPSSGELMAPGNQAISFHPMCSCRIFFLVSTGITKLYINAWPVKCDKKPVQLSAEHTSFHQPPQRSSTHIHPGITFLTTHLPTLREPHSQEKNGWVTCLIKR